MLWLATVPVEQRERFIDDHRLGLYDMTELCARYAISRKTGYKWLGRYDVGGRDGHERRGAEGDLYGLAQPADRRSGGYVHRNRDAGLGPLHRQLRMDLR